MQQQDNHEYPFLYQRQTCHQVQPNQDRKSGSAGMPRSEERFSRNAETDLVCRLLLEKKKTNAHHSFIETALDNGADEFLMKPFTPESLREKMLMLRVIAV